MPKPKFNRDELAPDGFKGVRGNTVPSPVKPQPQPTPTFPAPGTVVGKGNKGWDNSWPTWDTPSYGDETSDSFYNKK